MIDDNAFGTSVLGYSGTIPRLINRAAQRDPDGIWLRTDEVTLTFGQVAGKVAAMATALIETGIGSSDMVLLTARNRPAYLLSWLALASIGAICVPVNPGSRLAEITGLIGQVEPLAVLTDAELEPVITEAVRQAGDGGRRVRFVMNVNRLDDEAGRAEPAGLPRANVRPDDLAVLIPTSGTTGRSKLVMQTHRAYVMAAEGFPFWMGLTAQDRLMTSLPLFHINAPIYSVLGSLSCGAGLVLLPRFAASGFIDEARRHGATEFNAIGAMLEILMRQPERPDDADNPLRLCYTGPAPERARQEEMERRFGIQIVVGYAMSESPYGLIWPRGSRPYGTLGAVRQHPYLGTINEAKVVAVDAVDAVGDGPEVKSQMVEVDVGRDRGDAAAEPGGHTRLPRHARGNGCRADAGRLAADRRPRDGPRRWHLHVCGPAQGGVAPPGGEPVAA